MISGNVNIDSDERLNHKFPYFSPLFSKIPRDPPPGKLVAHMFRRNHINL